MPNQQSNANKKKNLLAKLKQKQNKFTTKAANVPDEESKDVDMQET